MKNMFQEAHKKCVFVFITDIIENLFPRMTFRFYLKFVATTLTHTMMTVF